MTRPLIGAAAAVLLCLGQTGCSGSSNDEADNRTATTDVPRLDETPAPDPSLRQRDHSVPANADVILPPFQGHGDRSFSFDARRNVFSLVLRCEGDGQVDIVTGSEPADPSRCRHGLPLRLTVVTDGPPHRLRIHTTPDTAWQMVAVEGDQLGPAVLFS